jgi:hypothetical protein
MAIRKKHLDQQVKQLTDRAPYVPTPAQIKKAAAAIRKTWTDGRPLKRKWVKPEEDQE